MTNVDAEATAAPETFRRQIRTTLVAICAILAAATAGAAVDIAFGGHAAPAVLAAIALVCALAVSRNLWRKSEYLVSLSGRLDEAGRNRAALDNCTANVMIADPDLNISYVMPALERSLARSAAYWAAQPSKVDVRSLKGHNIDVFHKLPTRIRDMLAKMTDVYVARIGFDGRTFELRVTPLFSSAGGRSGYTVEWIEKTAEIANAKRIADVIDAAARGDFSQRLSEADFPPEARDIAAGVNRICEIVNGFCGEIVRGLGAFAEGDLTHRMNADGQGRFAELGAALNTASERLSGVIGQIKATGSELGDATRRIASSSGDLSSRAESQAASLEETAATMHEMASTVKSNAENAERSTGAARAAAERAGEGRAVVADAVDAMDRIEKSSAKISDITALIDSIAFQTNLLALNASVEAARAGEAGKGFAVVASEVRLLAQRSAEAARDIKGLIAESSGHVGEGVKLVQRTGTALEGLAASISEVAGKVEDITAATREQSSGVEEISAAVTQMDQLTQQNAALAEESASAARSLDGQAEKLFELVASFRVAEGGGAWAHAAE